MNIDVDATFRFLSLPHELQLLSYGYVDQPRKLIQLNKNPLQSRVLEFHRRLFRQCCAQSDLKRFVDRSIEVYPEPDFTRRICYIYEAVMKEFPAVSEIHFHDAEGMKQGAVFDPERLSEQVRSNAHEKRLSRAHNLVCLFRGISRSSLAAAAFRTTLTGSV